MDLLIGRFPRRQPVDFRRHRAKNTALEAFVRSTFAEDDTAVRDLSTTRTTVVKPQPKRTGGGGGGGSRKRSRSVPQTRRQQGAIKDAEPARSKSREPPPSGSYYQWSPRVTSRLAKPVSRDRSRGGARKGPTRRTEPGKRQQQSDSPELRNTEQRSSMMTSREAELVGRRRLVVVVQLLYPPWYCSVPAY